MAEITETPTGQPEAPPAGPGLPDAPPSPQEAAQEPEAEPQVALEGEQPTAERPESETEPEAPEPSWRQAETFDAVLETEEHKAWQQEHDEDQAHDLRTEIGRSTSKIARSLEGWTQQGNALSQELNDHVESLREALAGTDDATRRQATRVLEGSFGKLSQQFIANQAWSMTMTSFEQFLEAQQPGFYAAHQDEFWEATAMNQDAAVNPAAMRPAFERLWKTFMRKHDKELRDSVRAELETKERGRKDTETRAAERERGAAPAKVAGRGGGGGRSPDDVMRDPGATPDQKKAAYREKHGVDIDALVPAR